MPRLRIPQTADDHAWLVEVHNDPDVLRNLTDPREITFDSHIRWYATKGLNNKVFIYEIEDESGQDWVKVGVCKFRIDESNSSCVLGADIHKAHRGQGYAIRMWECMLEQAFDRWQVNRVSLTTAEYNTLARRVYTRLAFVEEGRFKQSLFRDIGSGWQFYDEILMYMTKEDWDGRKSI